MAAIQVPPLEERLRDVPADKLDQPCIDEHLNQLSLSLTEWETIAPFLGLKETSTEEIERENPRVKRQRIELFTKWKQKYGDAATYRRLIEAFEKVERRDLVDKVCGLLVQESQPHPHQQYEPLLHPQPQPYAQPHSQQYMYPHPPLQVGFQLQQSQPHPQLQVGFQLQQSRPHPQHPNLHQRTLLPNHPQLPLAPPTQPQSSAQPHPQQVLPLQPQPVPPVREQSTIQSYADYLKQRYRAQVPTFSTQWPPPPTHKVINLALIRKEKVGRGALLDDKFVQLTLQGSVDDILELKTPVKLEEIFTLDEASRKVILIEGAPGSGKTTLAWDICQKWESGKLFQEFTLVVLVQLRDPTIQSAQTISDLLPHSNASQLRDVVAEVEAQNGRGILWVLDGWDEVPPPLQQSSLFRQLIEPPWAPTACTLSQSAVIVTSRPTSSAELHPLASSRVEVIGFTPAQLNEYFEESLEHNSQDVQKLKSHLSQNPVVESSCYIPLNAAIIVHLFLALGCTLPSTLHRIFCLVVACSIFRYMKDRANRASEVPPISSFDDHTDIRLCFPTDIREHFKSICRLAFCGIWENKLTFSVSDLQRYSLPSGQLCTLGLLQEVESLVCVSKSVTYHFLHLSVQELLAAFHISELPPTEQVGIFQSLVGHPRFMSVLQFYAGITKLRTPGIQDVIAGMVRSGSKLLRISVLRCLHEAQDQSLCLLVAQMLQWNLDLQLTTLSPTDCLSVGYFSACVCLATGLPQEFKFHLNSCSLDDNCVKYLMKGIMSTDCSTQNSSRVPLSTSPCKMLVWLCNNNIQAGGAQYIGEALRNSSLISKLSLMGNSTNHGVGEDGLCHIAESLQYNSSLVELNLEDCSIQITDHSGPVVTQMLEKNNTLQLLNLSKHQQVSDSGALYIAEGLKQNTALRELYLKECGITAAGAKSLAQALTVNRSLQLLVIASNGLTDVGVADIAESLKHNVGLKQLPLNKCSITDKGVETLAGTLRVNMSLETLFLNDNTITDSGAGLLASALKVNQSLKHLEVDNNRISDKGVEELADMLVVNKTLQILVLGRNEIQGSGLLKLGTCLKSNRTLQKLGLVFPDDSNHPVLLASLKQFVSSLADNCGLRLIFLNQQHCPLLGVELEWVNTIRRQRGYPVLMKAENPILYETFNF